MHGGRMQTPFLRPDRERYLELFVFPIQVFVVVVVEIVEFVDGVEFVVVVEVVEFIDIVIVVVLEVKDDRA